MLKEAIEKIIEVSQPIVKEIDGKTYVVDHNGNFFEVTEETYSLSTITLSSLDSLVKMVKTEALVLFQSPIYITIPTHMQVQCFSHPDTTKRFERRFFYEVRATDVPGWESNTSLKFDEAMIALRTRFQESPDATYALKLLSDITTGSKVTYSDNGVATSIVTKTGVALQTNESIRPIVVLKPYRTFQEVEQPASQFLIRINERGINFVEADGGMWKFIARNTIKKYLEDFFKDEIEKGNVVITL